MINEIYHKKFDNSFKDIKPSTNDYIIAFKGNDEILVKRTFNHLELPKFISIVPGRHIFDIDDDKYFYVLYDDLFELDDSYEFIKISAVRNNPDKLFAFASVCGKHYHYFLSHAKYCGMCGTLMVPSKIEMANICPNCSNIKYPDIMPAIAVAIMHGDEILLTKYANKPSSNYALVAGYQEIGETLEECVRREVMEEVGINIKNIKYYSSQPWGFSNTIMIGFTAEAINTNITLQEDELKEAIWVKREDIEYMESPTSMSHQMIQDFKNKKIKND